MVRVHEDPSSVNAPSVSCHLLFRLCHPSTWVNQTSLLVLGISGLFVLVAIVVLWVAARSVSRPLNWLCREAEKIGTGDFSEIAPTFSLRELEQLRESMNEMARQLQRSAQVQKDFFQNVSHELHNPLMSISGYAQGYRTRGVPCAQGGCPHHPWRKASGSPNWSTVCLPSPGWKAARILRYWFRFPLEM